LRAEGKAGERNATDEGNFLSCLTCGLLL